MVASDRVSAFDVVMAEPITDKGRVLTAMTCFWCEEMADVVPGTLLAADPAEIAAALGGKELPPEWAGRAVLVRRAEMLHDRVRRPRVPGRVGLGGVRAHRHGPRHARCPTGLLLASQLEEPIFTPSTKAAEGHDVNIDFAERGRPGRRRGGPGGAGRSVSSSTAAPRRAAPRPASSWPTPSSSWATSTACSACATRCARPTRRACGRPTRWCPARRRRPSTSSRCATGWPPSPGTARRPRPRCRPRSPSALSARYVAAYERVTGRPLSDWYGATP